MVIALAVAAAPAFAKCQLQKFDEIPVTMRGPRPVIAAKVNGVEGHFLVDTGAFFSFLHPAAVKRFGLSLSPAPWGMSVNGLTGQVAVKVTRVKTFALLQPDFHNVDFLVDVDAADNGIDGIVGQNLLGFSDIEYDLGGGAIRVFKSVGCQNAELAYWAQGQSVSMLSIDPASPQADRIRGEASVNGARIHAIFDTGSPYSYLTLHGAGRAGLARTDPAVTSGGLVAGAGGRFVDSWIGPVKSFELGGEKVENTRLRFDGFDMDDADLNLGDDFFLSHRIFVARSQNRMYFTYNGGPVFNLQHTGQASAPAPSIAGGSPAPIIDVPTDAAGYARRAAAFAARREFEAAIADDTQAIQLEPQDATHFFDRGVARLQNHQPIIAMEDFGQALKLKPDMSGAMMMRGELRLVSHDDAGAKADFDAAIRVDPSLSVRVAETYARAGRYDTADAAFSDWLTTHPKDPATPGVLAARCRSRAFWGQKLDGALADCDQALRAAPHISEVLASRGLVKLRLSQLDPAIADFDAAIQLQPKASWALYGRGVAELRKGEKDKGQDDIAAATAITPGLAERAAKIGLAP